MIRVVIWAKRSLSTESLRAAISVQPHFQQVSLAEDDDLLGLLDQTDILLLIPDPGKPVDALKASMAKVRSSASRIRVIVATEKRDQDLVVAAFCCGARGFFCLENARLSDLNKCIERVHEGQIWANSEELHWVIGALERGGETAKPLEVVSASGTQLLSQREKDVVKLLLEGMPNREIARTLKLSEHTIKNYLFRIYEKLGISTRAELMLYVLTPRLAKVRHEDDFSSEAANGTWGKG